MSANKQLPKSSWLSLLIDGASVVELERFRAEAVALARPDQIALVESDARRALHLHALLGEQKRHAAELTVLNDLASQLTALHEPQVVLGQIAIQTRRLLGVDVAYIMLIGDGHALRIEVVDGSIGDALRGIELPRGTGIGGRVWVTGEPYWAEDYVRDQALSHQSSVDAAARTEQLGGILGVPLRVGTTTIGVLLAADRGPRKFSEHEVGLLTSLAAHAAVAIHNAELFEQNQRSAEETQRAIDLHEQLTKTVLSGAGLTAVVESLAGVLGAEIVVLDATDTTISAAGRHSSSGWRPRLHAGAAADRAPARVFRDPGERRTHSGEAADAGAWAITPIMVADNYAGCVAARRSDPFDDGSVRLLETGGTAIGLVLASDRAVAEAERRARGEFVAELLGGHADDKTITRRARTAGVHLAAVRSVVVVEPDPADAGSASALGALLEREISGWSAQYNGVVVIFARTAELPALRDTLRARAAGRQVTVCITAADGSVSGVRSAYHEALDGTALLTALGRSGSCALGAELSVYRSLFTAAGRDGLRGFIDSTIGRLLRTDQQHRTELTRTLEIYLSRSSRHAATAQALHIHVNTLYQRLARINDVLGEEWKDPDHSLDVLLALRLHRLSESLG